MTDEQHTNQPDLEDLASERTAHGILAHLHQDSDADQQRRIGDVMAHIDRRAAQPHPWRIRSRLVKQIALVAATIAIMAISIYIAATPQQTAYALIDDAILATRAGTPLRYEVAVIGPDDQPRTIGTVDMLGEHLLVTLTTPDGSTLRVGRDESGEWAEREDGTIERYDPTRNLPRWFNMGESTVLIESLDALLDEIRDYELVGETDPISGDELLIAARPLEHATRPGPDIIAVRINADSGLVELLELEWTAPDSESRPGDRPRRKPGAGNRDQPPPPHTDRPRHSKPPRGDRDDRPRRHRPHPLEGPPRFEDGHDPRPPRGVIFRRITAPTFPTDWFSPPQ